MIGIRRRHYLSTLRQCLQMEESIMAAFSKISDGIIPDRDIVTMSRVKVL